MTATCPTCSTRLSRVSAERATHYYCSDCQPDYAPASYGLVTTVFVVAILPLLSPLVWIYKAFAETG